MKNTKTLLLLAIASFSINSFAMTGRNAQKLALNFGGIIAANVAVNIAYADGQNKPENAPDYIDSVKYPAWTQFVAKYRCSPEIEQLVKDNPKKTHVQSHVYKYDNIPFYNKSDKFDRIAYAEFMKEKIEKNNLDHLSVPDKCVCHMYGSVWNVIVKEADKHNGPSMLSLIEVQQLIKLIEETGYVDIIKTNIFRVNENEIMIIDTEENSFVQEKKIYIDRLKDLLNYDTSFMGVLKNKWNIHCTPEGIQWLEKQLHQEETNILPSTLKKPDIDQIKKEYSDYKNNEN